MNRLKDIITAFTGVTGGFIASLFGGWDSAITTLVIFMTMDYASGLMLAGVFHKSTKTENGALDSKAGFRGLCRKGMILLVVLVAARLDLVLGTSFIRDSVTIAFIANETISLLENAALMGVPYPSALKNALELLQKKENNPKD